MKNNIIKISYKVLLLIVSTLFIFVGVEKILLRPEMVNSFKIFGLPNEFMIIIGFTELVLGIMLQTKYFTKIASHGLISILSFAILFHIMNGQYLMSLAPIIVISMILTTLNLGHKVKNIS